MNILKKKRKNSLKKILIKKATSRNFEARKSTFARRICRKEASFNLKFIPEIEETSLINPTTDSQT